VGPCHEFNCWTMPKMFAIGDARNATKLCIMTFRRMTVREMTKQNDNEKMIWENGVRQNDA
jgi:hypothetical protein